MKKCPSCGRAYSDMISVCPECNVSLNGGAVSNHTSQQTVNPPQQKNWQPPQPVQVPQQQQISQQQQVPQQYNPAPVQPAAKKDSGSFLWGIPGFLIPLVGVILYFCWKKSRPKTAAMALKGAGIGFFLNMVLQFIPV